jgi:hypothetical protein
MAANDPVALPPAAPDVPYSDSPRLLDRVRMALRTRHYSHKTEKAYVGWIRRFILFHGKRHPREMGGVEVGSGPRLLECARLRVKDVDFARRQLTVRAGKGDKDRVTTLPTIIAADLTCHLETAKRQHEHDLAHGAGWVALPWALTRKYPNAGREWAWQWVFPATRFYVDRETGQRRRHPPRLTPNGVRTFPTTGEVGAGASLRETRYSTD